jgi:hypothetical protein
VRHEVRCACARREGSLSVKAWRKVWDIADELNGREGSSYRSWQIRGFGGTVFVSLTAGTH